MRILWLDINSSYSHSSLAIPALDAQLHEETRNAHEWKIISGTVKTPEQELISETENFAPQLLMSTLWLFNHEYAIRIIKKIKQLYPECTVLLGGPEFLGDNSEFLHRNLEVDAVFKGEGEEIFNELISSPLKYRMIPGMCYLEKGNDGTWSYHDSSAIQTKNFASLSYPESSVFFRWDKSFIQIETSRGCFNTCTFCISGLDGRTQEIDIPDIRSRIENACKHGIREIRILDRTFNAKPERASEMLEIFGDFSGKIRFHLEIHPALMNRKLMERISAMPRGLLHLEAGIQSLDENVITLCRRKGSSEKAFAGIRNLIENSYSEIHTDLIAGLPGYTLDRLLEDVAVLTGTGVHEIQLELLKLLPGTHMREHSVQHGIKYSPLPPYEVLSTPDISYDELIKAMKISRMLDFWYNDPEWRNFFRILVSGKDTLTELLEFTGDRMLISELLGKEARAGILGKFTEKHRPELIPSFVRYWIEAGLSVKKDFGSLSIMWKFDDCRHENPLLDKDNPFLTYRYVTDRHFGKRYWFAFDKRICRNRPVSVKTVDL